MHKKEKEINAKTRKCGWTSPISAELARNKVPVCQYLSPRAERSPQLTTSVHKLVITEMASFSCRGGKGEQKKCMNSPNTSCPSFYPNTQFNGGVDRDGRVDVHSDGSPSVSSQTWRRTPTNTHTYRPVNCWSHCPLLWITLWFHLKLWFFTNN